MKSTADVVPEGGIRFRTGGSMPPFRRQQPSPFPFASIHPYTMATAIAGSCGGHVRGEHVCDALLSLLRQVLQTRKELTISNAGVWDLKQTSCSYTRIPMIPYRMLSTADYSELVLAALAQTAYATLDILTANDRLSLASSQNPHSSYSRWCSGLLIPPYFCPYCRVGTSVRSYYLLPR